MLTDEYGATVRLQLAKEAGENPVLVVLHHKIQTVYLDVKPAPHGTKQDLISGTLTTLMHVIFLCRVKVNGKRIVI